MASDDPQSTKTFYVTTPIYYVNARPHIGHAYTTIVADVLARRHRLLGEETFFLTGTDEHGQKIERSATAAGIPPQQFTDEVSAEFKALWDRMGLTYDKYIRTTDPAHKLGVQKLFRTLYDHGFIYLSAYTGSYCVSDEAFVDLPAGTPCPDCGRTLETVTEENFFFKLSAFQLPLLNLIESNNLLITPDTARNEVLSFLRGDVFGTMLRFVRTNELRAITSFNSAEYEAALHKGLVDKSSQGEYFVPGALKNLSISRSSFTWGIPVPDDVQQRAKTTQPHVVYVWLDALANYITAVGYGQDTSEAREQFHTFWPADLHLVGKEITRFHCVYWPAFLLALNPKLQHDPKDKPPTLSPEEHAAWAQDWVPKQITANGWLLFDNAKMSKSRGNVVRTETILDAFGTLCPPVHFSGIQNGPPAEGTATNGRGTASAVPSHPVEQAASAAGVRPPSPHERDLFAADVLRYFLLREIPFGQDGSFSFDALSERYNSDLTNGYGNLVRRTLKMIEQNFSDGLERPSPPWLCPDRNTWREEEEPKLLHEPQSGTNFVITQVSSYSAFADETLWRAHKLQIYLAELMLRVGFIDSYLSFHKPWSLAKSTEPLDRRKLAEVLYTAAEAIRIITALLYPILPYSTAKVWQQLGLGDIEESAKTGQFKILTWGGLQPGTRLGPLGPIFPRADKSLVQVMLDMEDARNTATPPRPESPPKASADPAAAPRTSTLTEPSGMLTVGGSTAPSATLPTTPGPYTEAPASGVFATSTHPLPPPADEGAPIPIDDFLKVELRVAQILVAERIPKADKLLRLEVDLGPGFDPPKRQILSGIAQWYTPEELIGRRIVVVANLAPRKMRGLESHGMLLAASEGPDGKPVLATFGEEIALGSRVR